MAVDDAYITFKGVNIHVSVAEPEGELRHRVFVLPSPVTSTFNWRKITPELAQLGCVTVMMDMPGFGKSDCGELVPADIRFSSRIAWGVLDEIDSALQGHQGMWHLMGHGSACAAILDMANMYPDSVQSQVHISPLFDSRMLLNRRTPPQKWYDENIADLRGYLMYMDRLFARPADDYIVDAMRRPFMREGARESFVRMLCTSPAAQPFRGFAPVMAIWGERDMYMTPQALAAMDEMLPEAEKHVLKTAGHMPVETHSHALRDYIRGWLRYVE